jgi:hypothetical protein
MELVPKRPNIAVVGGGPAGLMAAETLATAGAIVTVYDRMPSVGRKFLLAGRGGLNLTHGEPFARFAERYGEAAAFLRPALESLGPEALRAWCHDLGQPTFVGSSGRVFPVALKSSPLLRAWLARLGELGVRVATRHRWTGFMPDGGLAFATESSPVAVSPDAAILALGGASWPRLGSDGGWADILRAEGIAVSPFEPANAGFRVAWSDSFRDRHEGEPVKRIALTFAGRTLRGEALVTREGLEGGAIYALGAALRDAVRRDGSALLSVDLRPDLAVDALERALSRPRGKQSAATFLRKAAHLGPAAIGLLREATGRPPPTDPAALTRLIKAVPVRLTDIMPIARAISTAGGIARHELDPGFMLRRRPGLFAAGEMLDWEAPTGGYLLQASFATGMAAARGALAWLGTGGRLQRANDAAT